MKYLIQGLTIMAIFIGVIQGSTANNLLLAQSLQPFDNLQREDGSTIRYYLQSPALPLTLEEDASDNQGRSVLVMIQGSGCAAISQQSHTMRKLVEILAHDEVVWVEKRGLENISSEAIEATQSCPQTYYQYESLLQRVLDYQIVIGALAADYEKITILGGSEGAIIVGLLLQENLPINAGIALNGGGQYFIEDILWNIEKTVPEPDRTFALAGMKSYANVLLAMSEAELRHDQDYSSNHSARWWQEMLSLDMVKVWQQGTVPLLMIQTLGDDNVSVPSAEALFASLENYSHITTIKLPALDHGFKDEKGQSNVDEVIGQIQHWLRGMY